MNNIICGICGTQYSDAADSCPICGTPRDYRAVGSGEEDLYDLNMEEETAGARKKQIFDYDEVNREAEPEVEEEEEYEAEYYEEEPESNTALVVILVILIALLLLAVGFMFFRFFLPNIIGPEETAPIVTTVPVETEAPTTEATEATIPCTDLSIPGGKVELGQKGQFWLMNVQVFPQNTTDTLTFYSEDENVATVDEDGKVTAVGEGKTVIHIVCGNVKLKCSVTVDYSLDAEPATEESVPALSVEENNEEATPEETENTEATNATEETKAETPADAVLKLKKTDITMSVRYSSYQMELDCDIPPEEIDWMTMDSTKAIVIDGLITATGPGTTTIKAMYKGQVAECIVRCNFG